MTKTKTKTTKKTKPAKSPAKYFEAVGRRKTAVARVRLLNDKRQTFIVNNSPVDKYFARPELRAAARRPLDKVPEVHDFSVEARLRGGGIRAQAEALSHGLARALVGYDQKLKSVLKKDKLLTRDTRMKERRKFGLKKARKAPQWSKR